MKYVETKFVKYHSNILGSSTIKSHPDYIVVDARKIDCSDNTRNEVMWKEFDKEGKKVNYCKLSNEVSFKVLSEWDNDANTSGSRIRWRIPKGSKLIWVDENGQVEKEELT